MELPILKLAENAVTPTRGHDGDAGLDLYSVEPAHLGPGERWSVGTGIAVEIPDGHAGLVMPRSGLAREHGIAPLVSTPVSTPEPIEATELSESARGDGGFGSTGR